MSRSGYGTFNECDYNSLGLYRQAVDRAIKGKRGQAFLRDLADAMDAMPEKILIANELINCEGDCCTIGVVCKSRGLDVSKVDIECPQSVGELVDIAWSMAAEIEFENDEGAVRCETPEQRWIRMRKWVARNLVAEESPAVAGKVG